MKVTEFTKRALSIRKDIRDRTKDGWLYVGENGGELWTLHGGHREGQRIKEVEISASGKALWIKI